MIKMHPYRVSIGSIICTPSLPLYYVKYLWIPWQSQNQFVLYLKEKAPKNISKKLNRIKMSFFESKGQSTPMTTFDPNFMGYAW